MNLRAVTTSIVAGLLLITAPRQIPLSLITHADTATVQTKAAATAPIVVPFELVNRHIMLKVRINNSRPLSFVLDTGDRYAILDLERARELGLKIRGQVRIGGAGAQTQTGAFVDDSTFTVDGLDKFSQRLDLALPISQLASRFGQDFDGIIGAQFIKEFVIEVDYPASVLRFYDKDNFNYTGRGEIVPITLNNAGHPIIEAEVTPIGGQPLKGSFVVDLGSSLALALYSPFVRKHQLINPNVKMIRALGGAGAGGETTGKFGRVAELKVGKFSITQPITMFSEDSAGAFASSEVAGNIGAQVMNRFKILLDYRRNRLILEPNDGFGKPYDRAFSGLTIQADGQDYRTFRIIRILENSPGAEAGLQENDIISSIDGTPAAKINLTRLNRMFERPVPYQLSVRRGEQTLQVKITPRRMV